MRSRGAALRSVALAAVAALTVATASRAADPAPFPVRGLHVSAPKPGEMTEALRFVREALPKEGVNVLVVEFGYRFQFSKHPEVTDPEALSSEDVATLRDACSAAGVRLIPGINLLGHQSWARTTHGLLRSHPELDETPGRYPENQGIYCRSYCPLHPDVHAIVFDLMDELAEACQADAFHVGMDEVFLLGEDDCPRCKGRAKAELFAGEVRALRDHLAETRRTMWMWGDRLLDGETTGIGKWEASLNGTSPALASIPRDVVICDWHYTSAPPTPLYFAVAGLQVVVSPWRRAGVALAQLEMVRHARKNSSEAIGARLVGVLQTSWCGMGVFARAYFGETPAAANVVEAVACFKELFADLRRSGSR